MCGLCGLVSRRMDGVILGMYRRCGVLEPSARGHWLWLTRTLTLKASGLAQVVEVCYHVTVI